MSDLTISRETMDREYDQLAEQLQACLKSGDPCEIIRDAQREARALVKYANGWYKNFDRLKELHEVIRIATIKDNLWRTLPNFLHQRIGTEEDYYKYRDWY